MQIIIFVDEKLAEDEKMKNHWYDYRFGKKKNLDKGLGEKKKKTAYRQSIF